MTEDDVRALVRSAVVVESNDVNTWGNPQATAAIAAWPPAADSAPWQVVILKQAGASDDAVVAFRQAIEPHAISLMVYSDIDLGDGTTWQQLPDGMWFAVEKPVPLAQFVPVEAPETSAPPPLEYPPEYSPVYPSAETPEYPTEFPAEVAPEEYPSAEPQQYPAEFGPELTYSTPADDPAWLSAESVPVEEASELRVLSPWQAGQVVIQPLGDGRVDIWAAYRPQLAAGEIAQFKRFVVERVYLFLKRGPQEGIWFKRQSDDGWQVTMTIRSS